MKTCIAQLLGRGFLWLHRTLWQPALLGCFFVAAFSASVGGAPFDKLIDFTQPDGTPIRLHGRGDEFSAHFETLEGYTVIFDQAQHAYCFARQAASGQLVSTGVQAHRSGAAALGLAKGLRMSPAARKQMVLERYQRWEQALQLERRWASLKAEARQSYSLGGSSSPQKGPQPAPPPFTTTGLKVGLTLLVDFSDDPATVPQADIVDFCNGDNYIGYGNNGSVKEYLFDNSAGLLTYTNVVTIYIRAPQAKTVYNDTTKDCGAQANILIKDVLDTMKALPNFNTEILPLFNALTVDNNNQVVACNVFYTGDNGGVWTYGLWPHSWALYDVGPQELSPGGKKVWRYQVTNIGNTLAIGTFCHENGHMLCGYPDLYDYEYDSVGGAGNFSLMGYGNVDHNPVQIDAYLKLASGWATTTELDAFSSLVATSSAPAGPNFNHFYRFQKPGVPTEYFLVENRQQLAHDVLIPGPGIALWHVDELGDRDNQSLVYNSVHANYELTLVQADNLWHLENYLNAGDSSDLYYSGNTAAGYLNQFSDATAPSARWWDGSSSGLRFSAFSANNPDMSFRVGAGAASSVTIYTNFLTGGNGNGIIDPNECNTLSLVLTNVGLLPGTGLHATLSTLTPGVSIAQAASAYPDILPGGSAINQSPFRISTSPVFVCGTPVDFTLLLKSDQGTTITSFRLSSGRAGLPVQFNSTNAPLPIPDGNSAGVYSSVLVSNIPAALSKVTVSLFLTHTYDSDLVLELISPDGTTNTLSMNNGTSGQNYGLSCDARTTFDDAAPVAISAGIPPWAGSFRPDQPLSIFTGKSGTNVNGTWLLHLVDQYSPYAGILQCWSLNVTPAICTDGGGECPGADLALGMTAMPEPVFVSNSLAFSISVTNIGPSSAKAVTVSQLLPAGFAFVSASSSQGSCSQAGGVLTAKLGGMLGGAKATISVLTVPATPGTFSSTATASSEQPDFNPLNNSATVTSHVYPQAADLAVTIANAPPNPLAGSVFSYNIEVLNNGPSAANNVVVTNILPPSVSILSTSSSRGSISIVGNVVRCSFGTLQPTARATATFQVRPTLQGLITATAIAAATQNDPLLGNNVASVSTAVGPAADLLLSGVALPNPVVQQGLLTYRLTISNQGPSTASSLILNGTLPGSITVNSNFASQGSLSISGTDLSGDLGSLPGGASASVFLYTTPTASGPDNETILASFIVAAAQADTNAANNSLTLSTVVAPPFVRIIPAGALLTAESFSPPNGAIDIGETVTSRLFLLNVGNFRTTNLVATLLATNGITPIPPASRTYGVLFPGGFAAGQFFGFTAAGATNGSVVAWLHLQDAGGYSTNVSFSFALPQLAVASNTNKITIPEFGPATNYPAVINVSGISGQVSRVTATLHGFTHTYPHDVSALLVSPSGAKTILLAHAGGGFSPPYGISDIDLTFDDSAPSPLPASTLLTAGTWQPTAYDPSAAFPSNAPAGPYPVSLSGFNGVDPNGPWSLYVYDDVSGDQGQIARGWSLAFTSVFTVNPAADLGLSVVAAPGAVRVGDTLVYTFNITNAGPGTATSVVFSNALPAALNLLSATSSLGACSLDGLLVTASIPALAAGSNATVTITVSPTPAASFAGGATTYLTNSASVSSLATDLHIADNTASTFVAINPQPADVALGLSAPATVVVGSNFTFVVSVTNFGPGTAFNVMLTNPLPPALVFTNGFLSAGTNLVCSFPSILADASVSTTLVLTAVSPGTVTSSAAISPPAAQSDPNPANNSASLTLSIVQPSINLVAAGVLLTSESFTPRDNVIEPGEAATVQLSLQNLGTVPSGALIATLLPTGGVTSPSPSQQLYGVLTNNAVSRQFSFVAAPNNGGTLVATLRLHDASGFVTNVSFTFALNQSLANSARIAVAAYGAAEPYPSVITVSNLEGVLSKAIVSLNGLTHSFPSDVQALLVSPAGLSVLLMSHAGGAYSLSSPITLTFDDSAPAALPNGAPISQGTYRPSQYGTALNFPAPAPMPPYGASLAALNAASPNGDWKLYIYDDSIGDGGAIATGWSLNLTTVNPVSSGADLEVAISADPVSLYQSDTISYTITVTNHGPSLVSDLVLSDPLPAGLTALWHTTTSGSSSLSGNTLTCSLGSLDAGAGAKITLTASPDCDGLFFNTASVAGSFTDLNPANNSATASVVVHKEAQLSSTFVQGGLFHLDISAYPGTTYGIQASTNLTSWSWIATNVVPGSGIINFTDPATEKVRFYRVVRLTP